MRHSKTATRSESESQIYPLCAPKETFKINKFFPSFFDFQVSKECIFRTYQYNIDETIRGDLKKMNEQNDAER